MKNERLSAVIEQCKALAEALPQPVGRGKYPRLARVERERAAPGVYFISDGEFVKIGVAARLAERLAQLQTGNARTLTVLRFIETDQPFKLEIELHEKFAAYRVQGEWFALPDT